MTTPPLRSSPRKKKKNRKVATTVKRQRQLDVRPLALTLTSGGALARAPRPRPRRAQPQQPLPHSPFRRRSRSCFWCAAGASASEAQRQRTPSEEPPATPGLGPSRRPQRPWHSHCRCFPLQTHTWPPKKSRKRRRIRLGLDTAPTHPEPPWPRHCPPALPMDWLSTQRPTTSTARRPLACAPPSSPPPSSSPLRRLSSVPPQSPSLSP
mmetsp:Transcript_36537/g.62016  ORF Transcript_36537/g.62016 Transcript_36537/m.62016 type:complete len:209 (+) Transcript_36537:22-648(+)